MSPKSEIPTSSIPAGLPLPDRIHTFDISYRIVRPEDFGSLGIDPQDIPVGTYVANWESVSLTFWKALILATLRSSRRTTTVSTVYTENWDY